MVWNQKVAFRLLLLFLGIAFAFMVYFVFFDDSDNGAEDILKFIGFDSSDGPSSDDAIQLPQDPIDESSTSSESSGSGGAGSSSSAGSSILEVLPFCTFGANHIVNGNVP